MPEEYQGILDTLPFELGTIIDSYVGKGEKIVYLIASDSGYSPTAEMAVLAILEKIHVSRPIATVFINCNSSQHSDHLERGYHQETTDVTRDFPIEDIKRSVTEHFVKSGRISGALGFEFLSHPQATACIVDQWYWWAQQQEVLDAIDCKAGAIGLAQEFIGTLLREKDTNLCHEVERLISFIRLEWPVAEWAKQAKSLQPFRAENIIQSLRDCQPELADVIDLLAHCAKLADQWYLLSEKRLEAIVNGVVAKANTHVACDFAVVIGLAWIDRVAQLLRQRNISFVQICPSGITYRPVLEEAKLLLRSGDREGRALEEMIAGKKNRNRIEMLEAIEKEPRYQRSTDYCKAADEYRENHQFDLARQCAERAIELFPNHSQAWIAKGRVAYEAGYQYESKQCFTRAQQLDPDTRENWLGPGILAANCGDLDEASRCLKRVLELNPSDTDTWRYYSEVLSHSGHRLGAALSSLRASIGNKIPMISASSDDWFVWNRQILVGFLAVGLVSFLGTGPSTPAFLGLAAVFTAWFAFVWFSRGLGIRSVLELLIERFWPALLFYAAATMIYRSDVMSWLESLLKFSLNIIAGTVLLNLLALRGPSPPSMPDARLRRLLWITWIYILIGVISYVFRPEHPPIGIDLFAAALASVILLGLGLELFARQITSTAALASDATKRFREIRWARAYIWIGAGTGSILLGGLLATIKTVSFGEYWQNIIVAVVCLYGLVEGAVLGSHAALIACWFHRVSRAEFPQGTPDILVWIIQEISLMLRLILTGFIILPWFLVVQSHTAVLMLVREIKRQPHDISSESNLQIPHLHLLVGRAIYWLLPREALGLTLLANALFELRGQSAAVDSCLQAIQKNPNNPAPYYVVSTLYCKIGNLEEASKNISKAIDLSPQEANNYFMRSLIHWLRGNIILARRDCDDAIRLWPSQQPPANLHLVRGLTWLSESYGARMALHDFRQAVKLGGKGNTSNYMFWQFVARQKSGLDLIEDQDQIMAAIESEKDLALKTRIHARLAALNGDIDIARQAYQQFLAENSQNRWLMLVEQASLRCLASIYPERLDLRSLAEWWDGVNPSKWTTG